MKKVEKFATVSWSPDDVREFRPSWSDKKIADWLSENAKYIRDAMVESGFAAIDTLLSEEDE